jgi:hypothetical protein
VQNIFVKKGKVQYNVLSEIDINDGTATDELFQHRVFHYVSTLFFGNTNYSFLYRQCCTLFWCILSGIKAGQVDSNCITTYPTFFAEYYKNMFRRWNKSPPEVLYYFEGINMQELEHDMDVKVQANICREFAIFFSMDFFYGDIDDLALIFNMYKYSVMLFHLKLSPDICFKKIKNVVHYTYEVEHRVVNISSIYNNTENKNVAFGYYYDDSANLSSITEIKKMY